MSWQIRVISAIVGDNKTNEPDNEEESVKEYEGEEEKEEIPLNKALEMADKLKMYCLRKGILIPMSKSQVSEVADKVMHFTTKKVKQSSIVSYFNKPVCPSQ